MAASRAPEVYAVAGVFLGLTWATALLRCYVRGVMARTFGLEDWLAILALLLFTSTAVFALLGISHSMGMHLLDIMATAPQDLAPAMMYWFGTELAYVLTTCALKMSIAVFLMRIAVKQYQRIILYLTMGFVMMFTIGYLLFLVFQCSPVDFFWLQFSGKVGSCFSPEIVGALTYAHSALNAFADIVLAILPVVIVSQLQMTLRTKITVSIILSMGVIACAAVVVRIPYIKILVDNAQDFLFSSTDVVIWSTIEPGLAITAANMATLRPLFNACLSRKKLWGTTTAPSNSFGYGPSKNMGSGFSTRKGYIRSGSRGNAEEMHLSNIDKTGNQTTISAVSIKGPARSIRGAAISEESLQRSGSWDIERQVQQVTEPIGEWPLRSQDIHMTVQTEVWSEVQPPLQTHNKYIPGPRTDRYQDSWPDVRPGSNNAGRKANHMAPGSRSRER